MRVLRDVSPNLPDVSIAHKAFCQVKGNGSVVFVKQCFTISKIIRYCNGLAQGLFAAKCST